MLTKRQRAFVDAFCADPLTGKAEAARKAGYKADRAQITACELMKHPEILREIERRTTKTLSSVSLTKDTVLADLEYVIEACKRAGPANWTMQNILKATELRGKILKLFVDRVEHGADDELMQILLEGRKRAAVLSQLPEREPEEGEECQRKPN